MRETSSRHLRNPSLALEVPNQFPERAAANPPPPPVVKEERVVDMLLGQTGAGPGPPGGFQRTPLSVAMNELLSR